MSTTIDPLLQITPPPAPATDRGAESGASFADELQRAQNLEEQPAAGPTKETKPQPSNEPEDAEAEPADEATATETSGESTGEDDTAAVVESDTESNGVPAEQTEDAEAPPEEQPEDTIELSEQAAAALGLVAEEATTIEQSAANGETAVPAATAETPKAAETATEGLGSAPTSETASAKAVSGDAAAAETASALPAEAASEQSADGGEQGDSQRHQQQTTSGASADGEQAEGFAQVAQGEGAQKSAQPVTQQALAGQEGPSPALATTESPAESETDERAPQPATSVLQSVESQSTVSREAAAAVAEAVAPEAAPTDATPKQNDAAGPPAIQRLFGERNAAVQQPTEEPATTTVDRGRFVSRVANAFRVAQQRDGEIQLRLSPPQLGSLKITLTVQDGALAANLEAESPAARGVLLDNLPALRERLAEQEIRVEKFDVNVRDEGGGQPGDAPEGDHRNRQRSRENAQAAGVEANQEQSTEEAPSVGDDGALDVRI